LRRLTYQCLHMPVEDLHFRHVNHQTGGPPSGHPFMAGGITPTAKVPGQGASHKQQMRDIFGHVQFIGMMAQDPPLVSNMVDLDPTVKDVYGFPVSRVTYEHHPNDYAVASQVAPYLQGILDEMGAESSQPVVDFV